jgi:hypothetical protein
MIATLPETLVTKVNEAYMCQAEKRKIIASQVCMRKRTVIGMFRKSYMCLGKFV